MSGVVPLEVEPASLSKLRVGSDGGDLSVEGIVVWKPPSELVLVVVVVPVVIKLVVVNGFGVMAVAVRCDGVEETQAAERVGEKVIEGEVKDASKACSFALSPGEEMAERAVFSVHGFEDAKEALEETSSSSHSEAIFSLWSIACKCLVSSCSAVRGPAGVGVVAREGN